VGASYFDIKRGLCERSRTIERWKRRFPKARVPGWDGRYHGNAPTVLTPELKARILARTRKAPTDGSTHWSTRKLAEALRLSKS
jgi:transposase